MSFAQQPPPNLPHPTSPHRDQLLQGLTQHGVHRRSSSETVPDSSSQSSHRPPVIQSPKWTNHRRLLLLGLLGSSLCAIVLVLVYYGRQDVQTQESSNKSGSAVQKAREFYRSCLDTKSIESAGVEPFLTLVQQLGGWGVSGQWNRSDFNSTLSVLIMQYSSFPFFNLYTLLPFLALCQRSLALLGAPSSVSVNHVGVFISLSSELAVATSPLSYRLLNGQLYQRITIQELQPVRPEHHVLLHNLPYIVQMSNVIQNGPLRTFMFLNLLHTFTPALDSRFRESERKFYLALGNTEPEVPRWKHCVTETEKGFDTVLTHFVTDTATHRAAEEMLENIFSVIKTKFEHLHWGDDNSRASVMKKVTISPHSYFSNYIQLLSLQQQRRIRLFNESQEVDIPFLSGNEVRFPQGMFVPPFFHATYPRAMNYGVLGIFITKDIFHLLLQDNYSLSAAVSAVAECVWAHYLTATGSPDAGNATVLSATQHREIWFQYSALRVAFQAYQQSLQRQPEDSSLLHLSGTRLFLTSFAQVNCDTEPYDEFMPLEPSFLITVFCSTSKLCPATLE
ncbi:hypothetical protein CRUP_037811, partial [Coryphaenoides rupestris]